MLAAGCLWFEIGCETMLKGGLAVVMAFVLFVGSVLIVLAAVFGRRMGYLVLAVSFFGWMIILSSLWTFGFFSGSIGCIRSTSASRGCFVPAATACEAT